MHEYKISVIVPIYNAEKYIEQAISSLLNQSIGFEVMEVILVDDCSTDRSGLIIDEYANRYDNIKIIHLEKNSGLPGKPRNKGLEIATCKYVMFLDQDDFFDQNACEILYNKIEDTDADVAFGYYNYVNEENIIIDRNPISDLYNKYLIDRKSDFEINDLKDKLNFVIPLFNKIYKRKIIEINNIKFQETVLGEDRLFACEYFMMCNKIAYEDSLILNYRLRNKEETSTSHTLNFDFFLSAMKSYELMYNLFLKYEKNEYFRIVFDYCIEDLILRLSKSNILEYEVNLVLEKLYNLVQYVKIDEYDEKFVYTNLIIESLLNMEFENIIKMLKNFKPILKRLDDAYAGNAWLNSRIEDKDYKIEELLCIIKETKEKNYEFKKLNSRLISKNLELEKELIRITNSKGYKFIKKLKIYK